MGPFAYILGNAPIIELWREQTYNTANDTLADTDTRRSIVTELDGWARSLRPELPTNYIKYVMESADDFAEMVSSGDYGASMYAGAPRDAPFMPADGLVDAEYSDDFTAASHEFVALIAVWKWHTLSKDAGTPINWSKSLAIPAATSMSSATQLFGPLGLTVASSSTLLGVPIANTARELCEALKAKLEASVIKPARALTDVARADPQVACFLLRRFIVPRLNHLMAGVGGFVPTDVWSDTDKSLDDALEAIVGLGDISCRRRLLALPRRMGGISVPIVKDLAPAFAAKMRRRFDPKVSAILRHMNPTAPDPSVADPVEALREEYVAAANAGLLDPLEKQRTGQRCGRWSLDFLGADPADPAQRISPNAWKVRMDLLYGTGRSENLSALSRPGTGMCARSRALNRALAKWARDELDVWAETEEPPLDRVPGLTRANAQPDTFGASSQRPDPKSWGNMRRADHKLYAVCNTATWDGTISDPLCPSAVNAGSSATYLERAESMKTRKYGRLYDNFFPVAFTAAGEVGRATEAAVLGLPSLLGWRPGRYDDALAKLRLRRILAAAVCNSTAYHCHAVRSKQGAQRWKAKASETRERALAWDERRWVPLPGDLPTPRRPGDSGSDSDSCSDAGSDAASPGPGPGSPYIPLAHRAAAVRARGGAGSSRTPAVKRVHV